jgi:hypothetical protein
MNSCEVIRGCCCGEVIAASDVEAENQMQVIGGREYTLSELQGWDLDQLSRLIIEYQETRRAWLRADEAIAASMATLATELAAAKSELGRARDELRRQRGGKGAQPV